MVSNIVTRPLQETSNAVERFAAQPRTNTTLLGEQVSIFGRKQITNRFGESGVQFWYNCCAFSSPIFHIQATGVSSNRTRLEVCAHPVVATNEPERAFDKRRMWGARVIMTNVVGILEMAP